MSTTHLLSESVADPCPVHHQHRPPSKPNGGTRFLVLVLQALLMSTALLLFFLIAGIVALVLVHLFIAGRSLRRRRRRHRRRRRRSRQEDHHPHDPRNTGRRGLSREEMRTIPCSSYESRGEHAAELMWAPDCAVCLEGFRDGDRYRVMPSCGHAFHRDCVDGWLLKTPVCPTCRTEVLVGRRL